MSKIDDHDLHAVNGGAASQDKFITLPGGFRQKYVSEEEAKEISKKMNEEVRRDSNKSLI